MRINKLLVLVPVLAAGAAMADTYTNLDFTTLQTGAQGAIQSVQGPAMYVFVTLTAIGVAIAVIRKLVGRR